MSEPRPQISYCPSAFTYPLLSKRRLLPCLATVRIVRKVDCGTYWVIDKSVSLLLNKQILRPYYELLPDIEVGRSFSCIANVIRPSKDCAKPQFCRAVASNFNKCDGSCTVFLIDFGETIASNIYCLYRLTGQPPIIFEAPGAAFLCVIKQRSQTYQRYAKLTQDGTYAVEVIAVDENEKFSALLYNVSTLEMLNEGSENEPGEEPVLRGSMLHQWLHPQVTEGSSEKLLAGPECCTNQKNWKQRSSALPANKVKDVKRLNEQIRLALDVVKLEARIDVQYAELSRKLDGLIQSRTTLEWFPSPANYERHETCNHWQHRTSSYGENFYNKQSRLGFRRYNNRGTKSREYFNSPRNSQSYVLPKGTPPKFCKHSRSTNEASTQTSFEILDSCLSRQSLAATTCSSACELELDESSLCASDTYSLTSPSKLSEKDADGETSSLSTLPGVLSALFPVSAGTICEKPRDLGKESPRTSVEELSFNREGLQTFKQSVKPLKKFQFNTNANVLYYAGLRRTVNSGIMRCWICGKVGSLTRYCAPESSVSSGLLRYVGSKIPSSHVVTVPTRKKVKKEVQYTSDESSSEESENDSVSEASYFGFAGSNYS